MFCFKIRKKVRICLRIRKRISFSKNKKQVNIIIRIVRVISKLETG